MNWKKINLIPDEEKIIADVLSQIKLPEYKETVLDDGAEIVAKINDLDTDDEDLLIDAIHIKNLPKFVQNQVGGVVARNIYQMGDVALTSITNGDILQWDGTNNHWKNVAADDPTSTMATVSANSTTTAKSLYTMTAGVPVEFRSSDGNNILQLSETNEQILAGASTTFGNATNPHYSFLQDPNTGIYNSAADTLNLVTGGTTRLTLDSSGNALFFDKVYSTSTSTGSYFDNTGFTVLSGSAKFNAEDDMLFTIDYNNNDTDTRSFQWGKNSASTPTELMRLTEVGYLGIGTATPTSRLNVNNNGIGTGTVATTGTTTLTGTGTKFLSTFSPGDTFTVSGETSRVVSAVASDTSLTVTVAFSNTASGLSYTWTAVNRLTVSDARYAIFGTVHSTLPGLINAADSTIALTGTQGGSSSQYLAIKFNGAGNNTGSIGTYFSSTSNVMNIVSGGVVGVSVLGSGFTAIGGQATTTTYDSAVGTAAILSAKSIATFNSQLNLVDSTAQTTGVGGGLTLIGKYTDAGAYAVAGGIYAQKLNSTTGNFTFDMGFWTRLNGSNASQKAVLTGGGNFGVGVSPTHRLDAYISSSSTGVSTIYGLRDIPSGTISSGSSINGVFGQVTVSGSSTISNVIPTAGRFIAEHDGSSTVDGLYGVYAHARTNAASTGVLANAYSLYAVAPNNNQAGNTITNAYSLYIESPTAGATLNYGLYQTGSANNYFGGKVGVGATSPAGKLHMKASTSDYAGGLILEDDGDGKATFLTQEATKLFIGKGTAATPTVGSTTVMVIQDDGKVGIGLTAPTSKLHVEGSFATAYVAKTANYTLDATDFTVNCTSNTFTITLPTAVGIEGRIYVIKNSGTGVITVDGNGSETIDGATTATLSTQYESITIQSTNAGWIII